MVLTVTEDTPADMLAGSMELLVQLPRDHHVQTQRVTVQRSTPMMDLLVQITTAHKLAASSYTLQAIGERGLVLPHQPNTPIGALDALQVKLLPKQGTFVPRKMKQANQPFETTFRLQVHLPRNQLYVSRVSPKMNLGDILEEVCREKNLDKNKYELRHPANLEETLDLSLSLQDYHLQEVTLYAKQGRTLGSALSTQDIMALQRQEDRRRQQAKQGVFGFVFKKSKEGSLSTDSLGGRSASPARSDETGRSASPLQPPARPQRKRRPAPKPPISTQPGVAEENASDSTKDKVVISHSRNSSDSSGYHEASVLSDNPDTAGRLPETLPRRGRAPMETARKLAQTAQSSKSLGNLATVSGTLARGISSTSLSSAGLRKKRAAPPPPVTRPLSSAISTQALERIVDSEESLTSDIDPSKPPSDIGAPSKANSDIDDPPKANSDIGVTTITTKPSSSIDLKASLENNFEAKSDIQPHRSMNSQPSAVVMETNTSLEDPHSMVDARVTRKRVGEPVPLPKPRKTTMANSITVPPRVPKRRLAPQSPSSRNAESRVESLLNPATKTLDEIPTNGEVLDVAKNPPTKHVERDEELKNSKDEELAGESTKNEIEMFKRLEEKKDKENSSGPECLILETKKKSGNLDNNLMMVQNEECINEQIIEDTKAPQVEAADESLEVSLNEEIIPELNTPQVTSVRNLDVCINEEITEEEISALSVISDGSSKVSREKEITEEVRTPQAVSAKSLETSLNEEITEDIKISRVAPDETSEVSRNQEISKEVKTTRVTPNRSILDSPSQEVTSETKIQEAASTQNLEYREKMPEKGLERTSSEPGKIAEPRHSVKEKSYCAVISTLPKCEHLDTLSDKIPNKSEATSNDKAKFPSKNSSKTNTPSPRRSVKSIRMNSLPRQMKHDAYEESAASWTDTSPKECRRKVLRSASKSNDFEINSLERQKRHLTSHAEDITFAMNLNLSANVDLLSGLPKEHGETQPEDELNQEIDSGGVNEEILHRERGIQDAELSETDILLQKVSDTLSNTLPISSNVPSQKNMQVKADLAKKTALKGEERTREHRNDYTDGTINAISPNITVTSQQDTSDYVSAMDEDLSIPEWEYQLPAPPSAFRDSASPVFDNYDIITLRSSDALKESEASGQNKNSRISDVNHLHNLTSSRTSEETSAEMKKEENGPKYLRHKQNPILKKEVISELQNKIGSLPQPVRESDRRIDSSSTPKVAPVDNTLSNFTITTYSRPKNVNIFEEVGQQTVDNADERFVRSFATLSRSKNNREEPEEKFGREFNPGALQGLKKISAEENLGTIADCRTVEPKMQSQQELHRWQTVNSGTEKITIQRSKSYISVSDKGKYQTVTGESRNVGNDGNSSVERNENGIKGASNVASLNPGTNRSNEKFSQWRENILKRQEEPTKEKQLQSLQVLKSILPQLKSAQQTEENVSKEYNGTVLPEKTRSETTSNEHSVESNAISARDSQTPSNCKQSDVELKKSETKRYIYSGPPAINLGSWSERPNANVQIKRDTDYKQSLNKVTNGRTIVNINGARDERDGYESKSDSSSVRNYVKFEAKNEHSDRNGPDELTKKLITHTTASGFKKPILNKVNVETKTGTEKPIVTGVELKKTFVGKTESKEDESVIDTTPVNFKELTKAFGQDVHLRSKPKRTVISRRSDPFNIQPDNQTDPYKQNGHVNADKVNYTDQSIANGNQINIRPKRFTSVVGIQPHNQGQSFGFRNGVKTNQAMPVVKGFKVQAQNGTAAVQNGSVKEFPKESSNYCPQPPKPPTMPVITGVTLKNANARPKSMPVQLDARDTLLESIRNFGGRENLKNAAERR